MLRIHSLPLWGKVLTFVAVLALAGTLRARTSIPEDADSLEIPDAIEHILGKHAEQEDQEHCRVRAADASYLGLVNSLSCVMNALGITAATTGNGVTQALPSGGQHGDLTIHVEVAAGPVTVNAQTFDWEARVWACPATADCTLTANFMPFFYWVFNNRSDGTNNGMLAHQFGIATGTALGGLQIVYDISSGLPTTSIMALAVDTRTAWHGFAVSSRSDIHRTGALYDITQLRHVLSTPAADSRVSVEVDTLANTGGFYLESTALANLTANLTPTPEACFTRMASADGDDFDYTVVVDVNGAPVTTGCSVAAFPAYTLAQLAAETLTSAATLPGSTFMGGMPANPAAL